MGGQATSYYGTAGSPGNAMSGSSTDGPQVGPPPQAYAPPQVFYSAPAAAAAPAPDPTPAPAPAPPPVVTPDPTPTPAPPVVPLDAGGPITQPTSTGNQLASAVLNPPTYWMGSTPKAAKTGQFGAGGTPGSITTTQV